MKKDELQKAAFAKLEAEKKKAPESPVSYMPSPYTPKNEKANFHYADDNVKAKAALDA